MAPLAQNGSQFAQQSDANSILNACADVNRHLSEINDVIATLQPLQKLSLDAINEMQQKRAKKQIDDISSDIMARFRNVTGEVKAIKQQPAASYPKNAPQVERLSREIIKVRRNYELSDANYRKQLEAQIMRQVKIVRPEATEQELRAAVEDPNNQIFSQALMQSDRQGQAQSTRNNVQQRHEEIQKIESQMIELAQLFEDMNTLVVQQEESIANIDMKAEEVVENIDKGTEEIGVAIESAKNTRKWKWWCLGIVSTFDKNIFRWIFYSILTVASSTHYYCHRCRHHNLQIRHFISSANNNNKLIRG
ncbi:Bgt-757 [Blumeria graminis f. sp. tritici]|uniref:Bgt-757 n=2 Tax=Blumeria graminis f. sp. tritici TaxID=62690 RepID=A0A061HMU9_BLUGR|nr:Plasma membrane t-SNARE protein [Blumeria graminis f. sp. tritici 96224]VDB92874.1 Bgt-757 [Blumeria graminis f. sp. tritici]